MDFSTEFSKVQASSSMWVSLNINRATICRAKYLDIATLNALPTSHFRYNSEEKSAKFLNPKMKLNKIDTSFPVQVLTECLEYFEEITGF